MLLFACLLFFARVVPGLILFVLRSSLLPRFAGPGGWALLVCSVCSPGSSPRTTTPPEPVLVREALLVCSLFGGRSPTEPASHPELGRSGSWARARRTNRTANHTTEQTTNNKGRIRTNRLIQQAKFT